MRELQEDQREVVAAVARERHADAVEHLGRAGLDVVGEEAGALLGVERCLDRGRPADG